MKSPISVLILEKSQTFSMYLTLLLQRMGLKALRVNELAAAKSVLSRGFTDILIVGDQEGSEPVHAIVKDLANSIIDNSIPIIVVSTCSDPDEQKACYDAGCQSYLSKPVQPKQLHDALYARVTPDLERRRNLRCKVELSAEVAIDSQPPHNHDVLALSKGGALISSSRSLPTGTAIEMVLVLDGLKIPLSGSVIYNLTDVKEGDLQAFCVLFHQISQSHADMIDQYLVDLLDNTASGNGD